MELTAKLHHATKTKADKLESMLVAEYPALKLLPLVNEDGSQVTGWRVVQTNEATNVIYEGQKCPDLADLIDACEDLGIDPTEGTDEDEPKASGSVVPEEYRTLYKEVSKNGQTCGDWLAEFLTDACTTASGFNVEDFTHLLSNNGVDLTAKWANVARNPGWSGRFRMNGRQVLERIVAQKGFVIGYEGTSYTVPEVDLAILRQKHAKWLAKLAKAESVKEAA